VDDDQDRSIAHEPAIQRLPSQVSRVPVAIVGDDDPHA
jgi:hypothetical protein